MTYNTIEELMNDLNSVVGNLNHKAEKKVLDEFYEDKKRTGIFKGIYKRY